MKNQLFAGAALAALIATVLPFAGDSVRAESPSIAVSSVRASGSVKAGFSRESRGLWVSGNRANAGAVTLIETLKRSVLDGFADGPSLAVQADGLAQRASAGDHAAASDLDRLLSTAWVRYVQAIERRTPGMDYADAWAAPRQRTAAQILAAAAAAPSLVEHIEKVSAVNPVYAQLREDAWSALRASGDSPDARTLKSLAQARTAPSQGRYIIVDAASANLWMIENGRIVGTMPVITGDADNATPMIASTIYQATLNPYWNVPADLTQTLIAPRVVEQGISYLTERNYEVLASYAKGSPTIDPATVDWKSVAAGKTSVILRRKPGQWNSMGQMKFGFPNDSDIFLHDTPDKDKFALEQRNLSHGCIRLSDAPALARWLLGRDPDLASATPEQAITLPTPVPIYVTHLDATVEGGRVALADRGARFSGARAQVASLR